MKYKVVETYLLKTIVREIKKTFPDMAAAELWCENHNTQSMNHYWRIVEIN